MLEDPGTTVREVAESLGVSKGTIYRRVGVVQPAQISKGSSVGKCLSGFLGTLHCLRPKLILD